MSLPFFDLLDPGSAKPPKPESHPVAARAPAAPSVPATVAGLAAEERAKLKALLGELEGLKKSLVQARGRGTI